MKFLDTADRNSYRRMTTDELRQSYMVSDLFIANEVVLCYTDVDRAIVGSAVPLSTSLMLPTHKELAAEYFSERREVGVINVGGPGSILVDGENYPMENRDSLYIGKGSVNVEFSSVSTVNPAKFYILSYPAHRRYETRLITKEDAKGIPMGSAGESNKRVIYQSIRPGLVDTCQLVMGFTELEEGSVWNTKPPHTHKRRSEVYMYFDIRNDSRVFHFMGEADETRNIVVGDGEVVVSPSWSIHCGAGMTNYTFIWGMGGENQEFDDMDGIAINKLR